MQTKMNGKLYVVATPIGNLKDITLRAIEVLQSVDKIAVEDTRVAVKLLKHYEIEKSLISLHEHNERQMSQQLIHLLHQGLSIALLSDAGTPLISDPGYHLIRLARQQNVPIIPIPGPSALITALCASGLPVDQFTFIGFLPPKTGARKKRLQALTTHKGTLIFYESPQRLQSTLVDMLEIFGEDRDCCVARELTKIHENIMTAPLIKIKEHYQHHQDQLRGEIVMMLGGAPAESDTESLQEEKANQMLALLLEDLSVSKAVNIVCKIMGSRKNKLYQQALQLINK